LHGCVVEKPPLQAAVASFAFLLVSFSAESGLLVSFLSRTGRGRMFWDLGPPFEGLSAFRSYLFAKAFWWLLGAPLVIVMMGLGNDDGGLSNDNGGERKITKGKKNTHAQGARCKRG